MHSYSLLFLQKKILKWFWLLSPNVSPNWVRVSNACTHSLPVAKIRTNIIPDLVIKHFFDFHDNGSNLLTLLNEYMLKIERRTSSLAQTQSHIKKTILKLKFNYENFNRSHFTRISYHTLTEITYIKRKNTEVWCLTATFHLLHINDYLLKTLYNIKL